MPKKFGNLILSVTLLKTKDYITIYIFYKSHPVI
jgi:hypothetical protein